MKKIRILTSVSELLAIIGDPDVRVVDCRFSLQDPEAGLELYLDNHIPGAVFADLDKDMAAPVQVGMGRHPLPDPAVLTETLGTLGIDRENRVIAYDQASGALASRFWWLLRWLGHEQVSLLDGGIAHWMELGLPLEAGQVTADESVFRAETNMDLVLTTDEIAATVDDRVGLHLVDAREKARFEGVTEPIDSVAGHIPGALNVPFSQSLNENGTWKNAGALRQLWSEALGDRAGSPWSVMCGSGVTACHLVASALLAGLPEPRVYVGSWSEWITDPARPVRTRPPEEV